MIPKWESTLNEMVLLLEEWAYESRGKFKTRLLVLLKSAKKLSIEIKKTRKHNHARYDFYLWQYYLPGSSTSKFYDKIARADIDVINELASVCLSHVVVWQEWSMSDYPAKYLKECKNALKPITIYI